MKDWVVFVLCAFVFVVGFVVLLVTYPQVSPQELVIEGEILKVSQKGDVAFITFVPNDFLVVSFDEVPAGGNFSLVGRLQEYKGRVEFVVSGYIPKNSDI